MTAHDVLRFAMHDLRRGLSRTEVEARIGVGSRSESGAYIYRLPEDNYLLLRYDDSDAVAQATIFATDANQYHLSDQSP